MYSLDQTVKGQQTIMHLQMSRGHQPIVNQLSMNKAVLPQKLARTVPLRANHKIKHFLLQQLLNLGTIQDNKFHLKHCWTVLPSATSLQRNVYNV